MGNKCCCCCADDEFSKLDDDEKGSLIRNKKSPRSVVVGECNFCEKKRAVCFQNYGSLGNGTAILMCIRCDIDLVESTLLF